MRRRLVTYIHIEYEHQTGGVHLAWRAQAKLFTLTVGMCVHEVTCSVTSYQYIFLLEKLPAFFDAFPRTHLFDYSYVLHTFDAISFLI